MRATAFEIGAVRSQGVHRDRSARLIADVYAQARRSGPPANWAGWCCLPGPVITLLDLLVDPHRLRYRLP